ncbi:MAG TPA: DUF5666 domain-containing protein [Bryobacteraceae bacterium]|jgi:hypothetical protein|nr:DUF5666 domain-containing protein [Bryobacteraceae bacterium]
MQPRLLISVLLALAAHGEQYSILGTVDHFAGNEIRIRNPKRTVTVLIDHRTVGASGLKHGGEVSVRADLDGSGKLVARRVWTKVVTFSATVRGGEQDDIEVLTSPPREEHRMVHLLPETALSTNRSDLSPGQYIRVTGIEVENGSVDAARITIYNTDLPARRERF